MKIYAKKIATLVPFVMMSITLFSTLWALPPKTDKEQVRSWLQQEVRHRLILLPYYSVFDNLEYKIKGTDTVILYGQVTRPILKSDAEKTVRKIEAVGKVVNNIEVLPVSTVDDLIRLATYRAIFSLEGFQRYRVQAVPPIHIIVKHGNVTLVGVVNNEGDKNRAGIAAREVPGVFKVTNHLQVETRH